MGGNADLDFTSLLDELMEATRQAEERESAGPAPSLQVDMLAQIERLQAENVALFPDRVMREYGSHAEEQAARAQKPSVEMPGELQPALEDLFFLDPDTISRELGIKAKSKPEELDKARRSFAMRYHPDRVPEEFRARAAMRMQIANMLIDEAKRGKR
ncbi:hypothetical protein [Mesorhizobium sp. CAU 1741]|uniref:hypothetical protein n=1 Tax=Mesorhizobium sp. CAU 1741 TaxID=3140366 RepID=UPI00325B2749